MPRQTIAEPSNLFEQCTSEEICAAATLCGIYPVTAYFREVLRDMPPTSCDLSVGEIARLYLKAALARLEEVAAANATAVENAVKRRAVNSVNRTSVIPSARPMSQGSP